MGKAVGVFLFFFIFLVHLYRKLFYFCRQNYHGGKIGPHILYRENRLKRYAEEFSNC